MRRVAAGIAGLALVGAGLGATAAGAAPSRSVTAAARTFAVGTRTEPFVDSTRPTPANGSFPGSPTRSLPTLVLYPASGTPGGPDRADATPAPGPFPLVVFAHGIDSAGADYEPLLRQWVEAGYVIAAPSFPLSNRAAPGGATVANYTDQPGDVSYVITAMLRLDHTTGGGFHDLLDARRIAVAGHSLGAVSILGASENTCCADPRVRAAVSIDGLEVPFGTGRFFAGRRVPLLLLHGDADHTVPYASSQRLFADAPPPKFFVTLHGAPHTAFRQAADATRPAPPWEPVVVATVLDFLNRYVKDQPGALAQLTRAGTVPGVASLQAQPR